MRVGATAWTIQLLVATVLVAAACSSPSSDSDPATAPPAEARRHEHEQAQIRAFEETKGQGLWAVPRVSADRSRLAERLFALGYVDGVRPATGAAEAITAYDPSRASSGLNLYVDGHGEEANLIDMEGRVVHRWTFDLATLATDRPLPGGGSGRYFRHAALLPNGDLLVLYDSIALLKLDKDSHLLWAYTKAPHHDFEVQANGDIVVLTAERRRYAPWHPTRPIVDDSVVRLDSSGIEQSRFSIVEAIHASTVGGLWNQVMENFPTKLGKLGDVLHANSVQVLDAGLAKSVPGLRPGQAIVSLPIIHSVVIFDPKGQRVVWALQGEYRYQHDAKLLPNGRVLLFDNQRGGDEQSAVREIDPVTRRTVWSYRGTPEHPLYSACCGTASRLPNGNTLIVETEGGRAFEVTPTGETVWEFVNPHRAGTNGDLIAQMFDLVRLDVDPHASWLADP